MVGVPALLRGCKTCRQKKIKCDRKKPTCGQCRKGVRICGGYDRKTTFVNSSAHDFQGNRQTTFRNHFQNDFHDSPPDDVSFDTRAPPSHTPELDHEAIDSQMILHETQQNNIPPLKGLRPELSLVIPFLEACHLQLLGNFVQHCLPPAQATTQDMPLQWLESVASMSSEPHALRLAISALGFGWIGHVDDRHQFIGNGLESYVRAVGELRKDISRASAAQAISTIAILTLYELYEFGTEFSRGWMAHLNGMKKIFEALGPTAVSESPLVQLFSFYRIIEVVSAFRSRRRTWLADFGWMLLPWIEQEKSRFQQFIDFVAEATGLVEYGVLLETTVPCKQDSKAVDDALDIVLLKLLELVRKMKQWLVSSNIKMPEGPPVFTVDGESLFRASQTRIRLRGYSNKASFSVGTDFDNLQAARLLHIYWTVLLDIYITILGSTLLCSRLEAHNKTCIANTEAIGANETPTTSDIKAECRSLADNISLYSEFCSQNIWQSFGPMMGTWSLRTAIRWYREHESPKNGEIDTGRELHLAHCMLHLEVLRSQSEGCKYFYAWQQSTFGST